MSIIQFRKIILQITPFLFLLGLFIASSLQRPENQSGSDPAEADGGNTESLPVVTQLVPTAQATPSASLPTATITPPATNTPYPFPGDDLIITILGPPAAATLDGSEPIVLYWSWPVRLEDDQSFTIQIRSGIGTQVLGPVEKANLGTLYQLQLPSLSDGEYLWSVHLDSTVLGQDVRVSVERRVQIVSK